MRFKNFINNFSKRNRIFSDEDMFNMSLGNIFDNEDELYSQYKAIGFPKKQELDISPNVQWVEPFTNSQGQNDGGFYQSILQPDFQPAPQPTYTQDQHSNVFNLGVEKNVVLPEKNFEKKKEYLTGAASKIDQKPDGQKNNNKLEYLQGMFNDYKSLEDPVNTALYSLGAFLTNYSNMKDANTIGADKYFHAKANYEAAQQGIVGSTVAKIISDLRELTDSYRNIHEKGYTPEFSKKDSDEDQKANDEGRNLGRQHPTESAENMLKHLMPKGLPKRYRKNSR